jgi:transcriptional regulator with XRE-family HTH domain
MDKEEAHFAARVKAILEAREMTQVELADTCEMGQPAVSNLLSRQTRSRLSGEVAVRFFEPG